METSPPKPTKKGKKQVPEAKTDETGLRDRFAQALLASILDEINLDGLAGEVAKIIAPRILGTISVQKLATDMADKHGEALTKELSEALTTKLLEGAAA